METCIYPVFMFNFLRVENKIPRPITISIMEDVYISSLETLLKEKCILEKDQNEIGPKIYHSRDQYYPFYEKYMQDDLYPELGFCFQDLFSKIRILRKENYEKIRKMINKYNIWKDKNNFTPFEGYDKIFEKQQLRKYFEGKLYLSIL